MANLPTDSAARPSDGQPKGAKEAPSGRLRLWPPPWWLIFLVLMIANYAVTQVFFPEPSWITIPYTFFKKQVEGGQCRRRQQCRRFDRGQLQHGSHLSRPDVATATCQRTGVVSPRPTPAAHLDAVQDATPHLR